MRHEQDLLARRKQAMLSQLTSLSALAAETAEKLPEVPDLDLRELPDYPGDLLAEDGPATEKSATENLGAEKPAEAEARAKESTKRELAAARR
jgi:hypothetical protein